MRIILMLIKKEFLQVFRSPLLMSILIVAPMVAWLDYAPEKQKGLAASAYGGLGMALGNNV